VAKQAIDTVESTGTVESTSPTGTLAHADGEVHYHGRPMSWVSVSVIIVGFFVGGAAMVPRPTWWAFWLGAGIALVGCLMTLFTRTFSDDWY
jgi:hypothetical protein